MPIKLPKNRQRGIGLVEVILVVAIAGFMITLAISGISNSSRSGFDDGMNQVLNNLRQIQNEAVSGQGPVCAGGSQGCIASGEVLLGKGVGFALNTDADQKFKVGGSTDAAASGIFARGYSEYIVTTWNAQKAAADDKDKKWRVFPPGVRLNTISMNGVEGIDRGLIVFARSNTAGSANAGSTFFFKQWSFSDQSNGTVGFGFTAPQVTSTYSSPQDNVVKLGFTSENNSAYKAIIEINTATGTMELKK